MLYFFLLKKNYLEINLGDICVQIKTIKVQGPRDKTMADKIMYIPNDNTQN